MSSRPINRPSQSMVASTPSGADRRAEMLRELKLALVDQRVQQEGGGFNPYDAEQGRNRTERWQKRRR
jgi:hypothetical protein